MFRVCCCRCDFASSQCIATVHMHKMPIHVHTKHTVNLFVWSATLRTLTFQDFNCGCWIWSLTWRFIFYFLFFFFCFAVFFSLLHGDMSPVISEIKEEKKQTNNEECNICSLAFAKTDKKIQFCFIFLLKICKWVRAWCRFISVRWYRDRVSVYLYISLARSSFSCTPNYAIATIFLK